MRRRSTVDPVTASYTAAEQAHQRYIDEISAAPAAMTLADTANQPNTAAAATTTNPDSAKSFISSTPVIIIRPFSIICS